MLSYRYICIENQLCLHRLTWPLFGKLVKVSKIRTLFTQEENREES